MKQATSPIRFLAFALSILVFPGYASAQNQEEKVDPFEKWLKEDVVYIIAEEEKSTFQDLTTAVEKENFIEQFWRRRDPDGSTRENEFKEEHYRRIAFANDHFHYAGVSGWRTDRGRIYIIFGEPQSRERYTSGAMYFRPLSEGGGRTRTFPYERWHYNHMPGIGQGVDLEFVDRSQTGDFQLALRPEEKDALMNVPAGGWTFYEMIGAETRPGRFIARDLMRTSGFEGEGHHRTSSNPFRMLETYFQAQRPQEIKFDDLRAAVVTRITYDELALQVTDSYQVLNPKTFLVPITVVVPGSQLTYEDLADGTRRATVELYGSITALGGRVVHEFEESIYRDLRSEREHVARDVYFQKKLPLHPGLYKLNVIVRDQQSGRMGAIQHRLGLPMKVPSELNLSSVTLAEYIVPAQGETLTEPFVTPLGWKVYPSMDGEFQPEDPLGTYFEIYGYAVDGASQAPDLGIHTRVWDRKGKAILNSPGQNQIVPYTDRVLVAQVFDLKSLEPGDYRLEIKVEDRIAGADTAGEALFQVKAPK